MPQDYNYNNIKPLDVFCTASSSLAGKLIRLYTARLKNRNGLIEFRRRKVANHCAIVVWLNKRLWLAEMVENGLKINSMRTYLNNPEEKIVAVKRHKKLSEERQGLIANEHVVELAYQMRDYDYRMVLQYLGLGMNRKKQYYCSELCEVIANKYGTSWDRYQLKRPGKRALISPIEIQFGAPEYSDFVKNIYL